jgi:N-acetylmuramoyl-L-alanine amidase
MTGMKLCAGFLLAVILVSSAWGQSVTVTYSDGRPTERISAFVKDERTYIGVSEVSRLLGLERLVDWDHQKITIRDEAHQLEIIVGGTVWLSNGETIAAGDVIVEEGRTVYLSLETVEDIVASGFGKAIRWEASTNRLMVGLPAPNIIDVDVRSARERVSATIRTLGVLKYDLMPSADGSIEITIKGGVLSKSLGFESEGGLIEKIEAKQESDGARLTVTFGRGRPSYRVFPRWDPDGIVVLVWKRALTEIPEPEFRPPTTLAWSDRFSPERMELDLVVLDPGHGGENFGGIGPTGYTEKEANLAISRKLKDILERAGIEIILTRNDDIFLDLETRTEIANSVGADLFISIHANGFSGKEAGGFEVYFLSPALDDEARTVAAMENAGSAVIPMTGPEPSDEVAFILWDTAQNEFVVESSHLAQLVDEELAKSLNIPNRGVKQADFVVLTGAYLPSVLIETAFITNPREEDLLKDEAFQETVANGIADAVLRFKEDYKR